MTNVAPIIATIIEPITLRSLQPSRTGASDVVAGARLAQYSGRTAIMVAGRNARVDSLVAIATPVARPSPTAVRQLGVASQRVKAYAAARNAAVNAISVVASPE